PLKLRCFGTRRRQLYYYRTSLVLHFNGGQVGGLWPRLCVRQASWQRIGGESPRWERSSQPPQPQVMRGVPRGPTRSVHSGDHGPSIELREGSRTAANLRFTIAMPDGRKATVILS